MDDIVHKFETLKVSSTPPPSSSTAVRFVDYFKKGSAGSTVFTEFAVPFLTTDDMVSCASACRRMNSMCPMYTLGDILSLHSIDHISREHKLQLGKLVMNVIESPYCSGDVVHRRLVPLIRRTVLGTSLSPQFGI